MADATVTIKIDTTEAIRALEDAIKSPAFEQEVLRIVRDAKRKRQI